MKLVQSFLFNSLRSVLTLSIVPFCVYALDVDPSLYIERCSDNPSHTIKCSDRNARCINWTTAFGHCDCIDGYVLPDPSVAIYGTRCIRSNKDECIDSLECMAIHPYYVCHHHDPYRSSCDCWDQKYPQSHNGECYENPNASQYTYPLGKPEECRKDQDCTDWFESKCVNVNKLSSVRTCQCDFPFMDFHYRKCIKITPVKRECSHHIQCTSYDPHSFCSDDSICECQEGWEYESKTKKCVLGLPSYRWEVIYIAVSHVLALLLLLFLCIKCMTRPHGEFEVHKHQDELQLEEANFIPNSTERET